MNAVRAPALEPVHGRAAFPVAWTLAWAYAPARARGPWAAVTWPLWVSVVVVLGGFAHRDGTVVVRVVSRRPSTTVGMLGRALAVAVPLGVVLGLVLGVASVAPSVVSVLLAVTLWAWLAAAAALMVVTACRTGLAMARAQRPALRAASREQRRADVAAIRAAGWSIDSAASRWGGGGLALIADHVEETVPPGDTVRTTAGSLRHAAVYRRYGLDPLPSRPLVLVGVVAPAS